VRNGQREAFVALSPDVPGAGVCHEAVHVISLLPSCFCFLDFVNHRFLTIVPMLGVVCPHVTWQLPRDRRKSSSHEGFVLR